MIDVLVVDDQQFIRDAVAELVTRQPDMRLCGTAGSGVEAVRKTKELKPHVVVMDVRMPLMDGIEATGIITRDSACSTAQGTRVLILTTFEDDPDYVVRAVRRGAAGFVGKGAEAEVIVEAIRTVNRGEGLLTPLATRTLLDRYAGATTPAQLHPDLEPLTAREVEILTLVAQGLSNQTIGERLGISAMTVKTHINRTMTKVGLHDRAELVVLAFETGLVAPRYR